MMENQLTKENGPNMESRLDYQRIAPGAVSSNVRTRGVRASERSRTVADPPDQDPLISDQRMRVLSRHAHARGASGRRVRRAALPARRLAGSPGIQRP